MTVGAATRDVDPADPRGWRLGGAVSYGAMVLARLGLPTVAIVGADPLAADAWELSLLRDAGVDLRIVPMRRGPVFENRETPAGRVQLGVEAADPVPPDAVGADLAGAAGWLFAPVAGELPDGWAVIPGAAAVVGLGWQGLLRRLDPGAIVRRVAPSASPILARADLVGLGRDDVDPSTRVADLMALLRPGATLVFTKGGDGGLVVDATPETGQRIRHYLAVPAARMVDATGAGDSFLAGVLAARLAPGLVGGRVDRGFDLLLGAVVASLVVEGVGLAEVPNRSAVRERMREHLRGR